ncbi:hypothetical protein ACLOJK_016626 [Asimina triloba]
MGKGGRRPKKKDSKIPNKGSAKRDESFSVDKDMDDEIDAFHKQRDVVPLDVDADLGSASDDDMEQPVFDFEDNDNDSGSDDDDDVDETQLRGLAAKIARQQKFLRRKFGGVEDEMHDDVEEEEEKRAVWGRTKSLYYSAENVDYELQSSDEDLPAEEEAEVLRLQRERSKSLHLEDFGLEDADEDESDSSEGKIKTLQDVFVEKRTDGKSQADEVTEDGIGTTYEEIKKDINALTKEEQMDVVYRQIQEEIIDFKLICEPQSIFQDACGPIRPWRLSLQMGGHDSSAPELVGLLSELNDVLNELEHKVNPLVSKVDEPENAPKSVVHYVEVKQLLLLVYCQAISFYLLLKAEGHSVRDHPVIARLVEIKGMLDKLKQVEGTLPSQMGEILNDEERIEFETKERTAWESEPCADNPMLVLDSDEKHRRPVANEIAELVKVSPSKDHEDKDAKSKCQNVQVGLQSMEMLKIRASLEEKLRKKGIYGTVAQKSVRIQAHSQQLASRPLETLDDFDDEAPEKVALHHGASNHVTNSLPLYKITQLASHKPKKQKYYATAISNLDLCMFKIVSGDDDLPGRDDIGERRRKFELKVLAKAGAAAMDGIEDEDTDVKNIEANAHIDVDEDVESDEPEDDFYKEAQRQRAAKIAAKAELYSRTPVAPSLPETVVDGKRQITYQMEKNRGLTRHRKKLTKIPRKKYKVKHQKAVVRRKGQVRDIRKPSGPYGGEATGINTGISRSIRFKS